MWLLLKGHSTPRLGTADLEHHPTIPNMQESGPLTGKILQIPQAPVRGLQATGTSIALECIRGVKSLALPQSTQTLATGAETVLHKTFWVIVMRNQTSHCGFHPFQEESPQEGRGFFFDICGQPVVLLNITLGDKMTESHLLISSDFQDCIYSECDQYHHVN